MNKNNNNSAVTQQSEKKKTISLLELEDKLNTYFEFRLDIILNRLEYRELGQSNFEEVNINSVYRFLHQRNVPVALNNLKIILGSDFVIEYNPIKAYFESIIGKYQLETHGDYIAHFSSNFVCADNILFLNSLKVWMVSAVNCALNPAVFNRKILVFFNTKQESGKTSLARFLVPPKLKEYSVENSIDGKDGLITLSNSFIHILDEMAPMSGRNMQEFKSFVSKDKVDVRPPYEAKRISRPRISSFIGTSDRFGFLPEDCGTSRFVVNELEKINFNYSSSIIPDILWSQAYHHLMRNEFLDFDSETKQKVAKNNEKYVFNTILSEVISNIIEPGEKGDDFMQTSDIVRLIHQESPVSISERKIGSALSSLKFNRVRHYCSTRGMTLYGYYLKKK
jgi:predicted P-loop ATPase